MLHAALALALTLAPLQDPPRERAEPETSLAVLAQAFAAESPAEIAALLQAAEPVAHPEVAVYLAEHGLRHDAQPVVLATIELLGTLQHPRALAELEEYYRRERKALRDRASQPLVAPLLRAIARHGDEGSIPLLAEDVFAVTEREVVRARILGLAHIRSVRSVEELFGLLRKVDRKRAQPHMGEFRLALMVLTGVDRGTDQDAWIAWWNDNKKSLRVPEAPPRLPAELQKAWNKHWGLRREYERQERRGERGGGDDGAPGAGAGGS